MQDQCKKAPRSQVSIQQGFTSPYLPILEKYQWPFMLHAMIGENRQLVTNELVEFEK